MNRKKADKNDLGGKEITAVVFFILFMVFAGMIPDKLHLYDCMTGKQGLENIILAVIIKTVYGIVIAVLFLAVHIEGVLITMKNMKTDKKNITITIIVTGIFALAVFFGVFGMLNRSRFREQLYIRDKSELFGDISLMTECIKDLENDSYTEYMVNDYYFDRSKWISASGRGGSSYHYEYTLCGRYDGEKLFTAQIGKQEFERYKNELPVGFDVLVTVYDNSGFIRSIESTVDFDRTGSYEHLFELTVEDGKIIRSEKQGNMEIRNLTWCGFESGQHYDMKNSLFGINAEELTVYPYNTVQFDEICLYAVADGQYRRVSNIIYTDEIHK
ncbi:MAG: hypothetical protein IJ446_08130 [Oscillospiraceae bacterium]|nr:hypothetical protein [Oscillospiraceae bacterium]